jgi:hypothetical protein
VYRLHSPGFPWDQFKSIVIYAAACAPPPPPPFGDAKTSDCISYFVRMNELIAVRHNYRMFRSPYLFYLLTVGVEVVYFHLITLRHTPQSVGLLWPRDRPVAETST